MGRGERKGGGTEAAGDGTGQNLGEWGETLGGARPSKWRKTPGGAATEWGRRSNRLRTTRPTTEKAGVESAPDDLTPTGGREGVESWQDDLSPHTNRGGVESSCDYSTPREDGGPKGVKTLGSPTSSQSRWGEDGRGRGEGTKTHPLTNQPGSAHPMAETKRRDKAQLGDRTRRQIQGRRSEPEARAIQNHTPPARLWPRRWEAQSPRSQRQPRRREAAAPGNQ